MRSRMIFLPACIFLCVSLFAQQRPSPNIGRTGMKYFIRGQVRSNENSQPIEMAKVQLMAPAGEQMAIVFTRSNGEFEFGGLSNGSYRLVVDLDGYQQLQERVEIGDAPRTGVTLFLTRTSAQRPSEPGDSVSAHELALPEGARSLRRKGAERLYAKADPKGSIPYFERATRQAPGYFEAYFDLGLAHLQNSEREAAEQALRKSIELSENKFAPPQMALASILSDRNEYEQAELLARRGLEVGGMPAQGHFELARALFGQNKVDDAEKAARQAQSARPEFAEINLLLANIHIRKRNYPALLVDLDTYLKLAPNGSMSSQMREMRQKVEVALANAKNQ
jgi:tetratricopeptide (TPR) repeat protein